MKSSQLVEHRMSNHLVLVYSDKEKLARSIIDFLNAGLEHKQLCVLAYVNLDMDLFKKLDEGIDDFNQHVLNNDLLLVELKLYKNDIIKGNYILFEKLRDYFVRMARKRTDTYIRFVGDLGSDFFDEKKFQQWENLEELWQNKSVEGCFVCPYDNSIVERDKQRKKHLFSLHDDVIFC